MIAFIALRPASLGLRRFGLEQQHLLEEEPGRLSGQVGRAARDRPCPAPWQIAHGRDAVRPRATAPGRRAMGVGSFVCAAK